MDTNEVYINGFIEDVSCIEWTQVSEHLPESGKNVLVCYKNSFGQVKFASAYYTLEGLLEAKPNDRVSMCDIVETTNGPLLCLKEGWYMSIEDPYENMLLDEEVLCWSSIQFSAFINKRKDVK